MEKGKEKAVTTVALVRGCRQFWKAGDYEGCRAGAGEVSVADMDHVRVHPKFLHSNATSHKWALGAFAELLDNALDEVCNGATYVFVDVLENIKEKNKMVVVQDNGGGMTPDKMRQCMSLGYSAKSKLANTIGQYGNGFKTSTMRLGADVVVFSRCQGKYGESTTQSVGMLSYTFLRDTGKEDIVVPMIDYEKMGETWNMQVKSSSDCWQRNLETIVQWSPYESEEDLLRQFNFLEDQGTRIIIYNLWEDELGSLELDLDSDQHDIQIRGANRDEKKIEMAQVYSSSRHFLTYRHSLRSYTSILYRRIPPGFRIILRGKDVDHHDVVDDLIHTKELVYKPAASTDAAKDPNMSAAVTLGFVKDARHHIDIQGFNVYHKNRLIKPFWRVWNAAGSDGRGVIGVLEANFVEPAHDKQGFERTIALSRLEARLVYLQKNFWSENCHLIGYAQRRHQKKSALPEKEASANAKDKSNTKHNTKGNAQKSGASPALAASGIDRRTRFEVQARNHNEPSLSLEKPQSECPSDQVARNVQVKTEATSVDAFLPLSSTTDMVLKLKEENGCLRNGLRNVLKDLQCEKDKSKSLENQIHEMKQKMDKMDQEQEQFVSSFSEERSRRDQEEENLRRRVKEASETIQALLRNLSAPHGRTHHPKPIAAHLKPLTAARPRPQPVTPSPSSRDHARHPKPIIARPRPPPQSHHHAATLTTASPSLPTSSFSPLSDRAHHPKPIAARPRRPAAPTTGLKNKPPLFSTFRQNKL
ncbi:protein MICRORCHIDIA 7 [Sesamum alatum]|uniref:Protein MICRORCHIDIA 7 n=1 Tax=Sesamum alatum TaxID=300844 RepID=A0AAE1XJL4_9LAMI|nr:protein MICRORCHIDIA 7 [Sesamum alatum]